VAIWTGFSKGSEDRTRLTFTWEPTTTAATPAAERPARLEVEPVDEAGKSVTPAQVIGGAPGELPMMAHFQMMPGRHRIRFTSYTSAGDVLDRWIQTQAVPDLDRPPIALATPRLLRARNMIELRAIEANPEASPTASTRFGPTDRLLVEIECRTRGEGTVDLKVELLNASGGLLRVLDAPPLDGGKLRMPLPVASLANGTYVLRVTATRGDQAAEQWVAFRVAR
jgi:hypothetical protein